MMQHPEKCSSFLSVHSDTFDGRFNKDSVKGVNIVFLQKFLFLVSQIPKSQPHLFIFWYVQKQLAHQPITMPNRHLMNKLTVKGHLS